MAHDAKRSRDTAHYIFGLHAVRHFLDDAPEQALELWVQSGVDSWNAIVQTARKDGIAVHAVSRQTLDGLIGSGNHQGGVLRCRPAKLYEEDDLPGLLAVSAKPLVLVLEGLEDPHNLGACLRTAEAAGVHMVITPLHRGCGITPTVTKVASGAAQRVPLVQVRNLARTLREFKDRGLWLVGTGDSEAQDFYSTDLNVPLALLFGNEGDGLRRLTRELCDTTVRLPMLGKVESLNVSVAVGIVLYEALRQRRPLPTANV